MKRKYYFIISAFVVTVTVLFLVSKKNNDEKLVPLKANVVYADKRFTITNNDSIDFIHAVLSIDVHYKLRDYNLQAGETYVIWTTEFSHQNGMHYPPKREPMRFSIWCEIQDGKNGFYFKKLK